MVKLKFWALCLATLLLFLLPVAVSKTSFADELSDIGKKITKTEKKLGDLNDEKKELEEKIEDLIKNISATEADITSVSQKISSMEAKLSEINKALDEKKKELSDKVALRDKIVRFYYERNALSDFEIFLLSLGDLTEEESGLSGFQRLSQAYAANKVITQNIINTIVYLNGEINQYEKDKKDAEDIKTSLDVQKQKLAQLKSNLAATSESSTVGDDEQSSSTLPKPSFKPAFAFFTYGYPHRVGANQYGMYGRSKAGQNYKDIIKAYFKNVEISGSCDKSKTIPVKGYGNLKLEDTYLLGIAEMPEAWGGKGGFEALKAHA